MKKRLLAAFLIALLSLGIVGCNMPKATVDSRDNNAAIENKAKSAEDNQSDEDSGENEDDNTQDNEQGDD